MIIIKPNCQYLQEEDGKEIEHIVKCAGICYGNDPFKEPEVPIDYLKVYNNLLANHHISPLRHSTLYYIIPKEAIHAHINLDLNPAYCNRTYDFDTKRTFVTINGQWYEDNYNLFNLFYNKYKVSKEKYIEEIKLLKNPDTKEEAFATLRYTFVLTTQISTSRELNRVSPNNICEQSTRYCKFSLPKFGEDVAICQPHWLDICEQFNKDTKNEINHSSVQIIKHFDKYYVKIPNGAAIELGEEYPVGVRGIPQDDGSNLLYPTSFAEAYIKKAYDACILYGEALKVGVAPQDARGLLPLDTATKVVYTYSYKEWQHIIDLRFHGTTGKPHPNAKEVIGLLVPLLEQAHNSNKK